MKQASVSSTDHGGGKRGAEGPTQTLPSDGIDLPNIAFGARTTLAYSENKGAGATLTVSDGRHAAAIALQLHGWKLRHHGRGSRRHARHGGGANGEPAIDHAAQGMMSLSGSRLGQ
jgi:hypothetical protein